MAKAAIAERDMTEVDTKETGKIPYRREYLDVTPAMAKGLLLHIHPDQRAWKPTKVEQYAQDMSHGNWREDSEDAILIDWHGYVIDGQNRLRAVVESGRTIKSWVAWGKDPAVMGVKDTGAARTVADSLRIQGLGGDMTAAELSVCGIIARRQLHWEAGRRSTGSTNKGTVAATHSDVADILRLQPDIYGATKIGLDASRTTRPPLVSAGVYGFFWLNANRIDSESAYRWQSYWMTPEDLPGSSPISVIRERLFRSKMAQGGKGFGDRRADILKPDEVLALLIRGWNLFLADRPANRQKLNLGKGKLTNENFPAFLTREQAVKEAERLDREAKHQAARAAAKQ